MGTKSVVQTVEVRKISIAVKVIAWNHYKVIAGIRFNGPRAKRGCMPYGCCSCELGDRRRFLMLQFGRPPNWMLDMSLLRWGLFLATVDA